jgi:hypothetical protein
MDCDFSHQPEDIPRLFAVSESCPLVVGSRFLHTESLSDWNISRKFLTHFGHWLTRNLLQLPMDATGAFRLYRLGMIPRDVWGHVTSSGYAFFFESLVTLKRAGIVCSEISIHLPKRVYGESKLNFIHAFRSLMVLTRLYLYPQMSNPSKNNAEGWDEYWKAGKSNGRNWYAILASFYRQAFIVRRLDQLLCRHFHRGVHLYHVGCGGGEVDARAAGEASAARLSHAPGRPMASPPGAPASEGRGLPSVPVTSALPRASRPPRLRRSIDPHP